MITRFFQRILAIDRRIIFVLIFLAAALPFIFPFAQKIPISPEVRLAFDTIENVAAQEERKPVLLSLDFDPTTAPELQPMAEAIIRHCARRDIPVIVMTIIISGDNLAQNILGDVAEEMGLEEGKDYVYLGFKPGVDAIMRQIGENIRNIYPQDSKGTPLAEHEMMANVINYDDMSVVVSLGGTALVETWIDFAVARYNATYFMGATGVMASGLYPYIQSGQSKGLLGGMKGAAEYERLLMDTGLYDQPGGGTAGMGAQSATHAVIVVLIVLGNVGYFLQRRAERRTAEAVA